MKSQEKNKEEGPVENGREMEGERGSWTSQAAEPSGDGVAA